jgi:hypothetical protein
MISASASLCAYAGQETHGGHGVVCPAANGGKTVELLDYYEGKFSTALELDTGSPQADFMEQVSFVLNRLAKIDPVATERFTKRAQNFMSEAGFVSETQIKPIADANEIINPEAGCYKTQFAVQVMNPRMSQKRYLINSQLWEIASPQTKAGLVLHEIIYTDAVASFGHKTSDYARYYNFIISSEKMREVTPDYYIDLLTQSGLVNDIPDNQGFYNGCLFSAAFKRIALCINRNLQHGYVHAESNQPVPVYVGQTVYPKQITTSGGVQIQLPARSLIRMNDQERILSIYSSNWSASAPEFSIGEQKVRLNGGLQFYETGEIQTGALREDQVLRVGNQEIQFTGGIEFFKGGQVKSGTPAQNSKIRVGDTSAYFDSLDFYESGKVKSGTLNIYHSAVLGCLVGGVSFTDSYGNPIYFTCASFKNHETSVHLSFDEQGHVIRK